MPEISEPFENDYRKADVTHLDVTQLENIDTAASWVTHLTVIDETSPAQTWGPDDLDNPDQIGGPPLQVETVPLETHNRQTPPKDKDLIVVIDGGTRHPKRRQHSMQSRRTNQAPLAISPP